jgi:hypothetical protein
MELKRAPCISEDKLQVFSTPETLNRLRWLESALNHDWPERRVFRL